MQYTREKLWLRTMTLNLQEIVSWWASNVKHYLWMKKIDLRQRFMSQAMLWFVILISTLRNCTKRRLCPVVAPSVPHIWSPTKQLSKVWTKRKSSRKLMWQWVAMLLNVSWLATRKSHQAVALTCKVQLTWRRMPSVSAECSATLYHTTKLRRMSLPRNTTLNAIKLSRWSLMNRLKEFPDFWRRKIGSWGTWAEFCISRTTWMLRRWIWSSVAKASIKRKRKIKLETGTRRRMVPH